MDREEFASYWSDTLPLRNKNRSVTVLELIQGYAKKMGKTVSYDVLTQVDHELGQFQDAAILQPRPGVERVLKLFVARGLKLGILSNCDEREVRRWPGSPLARYFQAVCSSCDVGFEKPEPESYQAILERLGTTAEEAAYVGDGGSQELQGARAAGFSLVIFLRMFVARNGLRTQAELETFGKNADSVVDSFEELVRIFGTPR